MGTMKQVGANRVQGNHGPAAAGRRAPMTVNPVTGMECLRTATQRESPRLLHLRQASYDALLLTTTSTHQVA